MSSGVPRNLYGQATLAPYRRIEGRVNSTELSVVKRKKVNAMENVATITLGIQG